MDYRRLGNSGLVVSVVGLGCNAFGERADPTRVSAMIDTAMDRGVTLFDTSDSYSAGLSEELLGAALQGRRDEVVIATKFGMPNGGITAPAWMPRASRAYVRRSVEGSLKRLRTDYIDLYQVHEPDVGTPWEETLSALEDLVTVGKIRYYGASNLLAWELVDAQRMAQLSGFRGFVSTQAEYSLYNRQAERELVPACERLYVGLLPYFPLAMGLLTGKYRPDAQAPKGSRLENYAAALERADFQRITDLEQFASERGRSLIEVAMAGLAAQPSVGSVIAGATTAEQVIANVAAADWHLTEDDVATLATINTSQLPDASYIYRSAR